MHSKYPNLKQSIFLLLLIGLILMALGLIVGILSVIFNYNINDNPSLFGIMNLIAIGIFLFRAKKKTKCEFKTIYPLKKTKLITLLSVFFLIIGLSITLSEMDNILRALFPIPNFLKNFLDALTSAPKNIIGSIFLVSIIAPFTEELLFRGLILQSYLNQYSAKKAVILSSLLFALFHFNPAQFLHAFILGIVFSLIFIKYKSLIPCLFGHALSNLLTILILFKIGNFEINGYTSITAENHFQPLWLDAIGIMLLIIGLFSLKIIPLPNSNTKDIEILNNLK